MRELTQKETIEATTLGCTHYSAHEYGVCFSVSLDFIGVAYSDDELTWEPIPRKEFDINDTWISFEDELPPSKKVLIYWRPIDHEIRSLYREIIVGELAYESTSKIWANGMYYDIKTHATHWQPLPPPPKLTADDLK